MLCTPGGLCLPFNFRNKLSYCVYEEHFKSTLTCTCVCKWFEFCSRHYTLASTMFRSYSGKPCPPFKIVILDEADSMTSAAQVSTCYVEYMY